MATTKTREPFGQWLFQSAWVAAILLAIEIVVFPRAALPELFSLESISHLLTTCGLSAIFVSLLHRLLLRLGLIVILIAKAYAMSSYNAVFNTLPHIQTLMNQGGEGASAAQYGFAISNHLLILAVLIACIPLLIIKLRNRKLTSPFSRFVWSTVFTACVMIMADTQFSLRRSVGHSTDALAKTVGIVPAWVLQLVLEPTPSPAISALHSANAFCDELECSLPLRVPVRDRVLVLQIESLEFGVLNQNINGKKATPFIDSILERSLVLRTRAIHDHGSCDADYSVINAAHPSRLLQTYTIPNMSFDRALPKKFPENCTNTFVHGNEGSFYQREPALKKMGFDQLIFSPDMDAKTLDEGMTTRVVDDRDSMALLAPLVNKNDCGLTYYISMTSHGPFHAGTTRARTLFENAQRLDEAYLNTIRYVDDELAKLVGALTEPTTLIIFGDHLPVFEMFGETHYTQAYGPNGEEYVPFILYDTEEEIDANALRLSDDVLANESALPYVSTLVHRKIEEHFHQKEEQKQKKVRDED